MNTYPKIKYEKCASSFEEAGMSREKFQPEEPIAGKPISNSTSTQIFTENLAGDYIWGFDEFLAKHPDLGLLCWARVSSREQYKNENLTHQIFQLRTEMAKRGRKALWVFRSVASGWDFDNDDFRMAIWLAKKERCALVAETPARFLRSLQFHSSRHPDAQPSRGEWASFKRIVSQVPLLSILHPSADPSAVRRYESLRGMLSRGTTGGRPQKCKQLKIRREMYLSRVLTLRYDWGFSYREIANEIGIPWRTIVDWLKPFEHP